MFRMLKLVLLFLTLSGLQAVPLAIPRRLQRTSSTYRLPDGFRQGTEPSNIPEPVLEGFRQGTEPSRRFIVDLNTGLVQEHISEMERRATLINPALGRGLGEMERRHRLTVEVPADVPAQKKGGGWVRVEEPSVTRLSDGFRQGTEPVVSIPKGFRQGTEPMMHASDILRREGEPLRAIPAGFRQGTEPSAHLPEGFKQGTEPVVSIPKGFRQGTEPMVTIPKGFRQGTEPVVLIPEVFRRGTERVVSIPDGFRQGTEPMMHASDSLRREAEPLRAIPAGFRQGTEPSPHLPEGFKQGTERFMSIPDGFRQGTEPMVTIPKGFRQGTEPMMHASNIPAGFRQGTELSSHLPEGFKQGTEPFMSMPDGFRQGTEPSIKIPQGFRQGTEPSSSSLSTKTLVCKGEVIDGKCFEFNTQPLSFQDAQDFCRALIPNGELASVTSRDLHSRLVSLVTAGGENNPVLTWLGGTVKNQQASWVDGSEWSYSDWMPGHPNIHTDKPVCVEMFKIDQSWWTAADCELKRASICSFPITA